jgi:hypothetical protein
MRADARHEFTPLELMLADDHEHLMMTRVRILMEQLSAKKERALEDFLVSGAMPRDLCVEEGPVWTEVVQGPHNHVLNMHQHWRVK